jgi:hypothetical protein
MTGITLQDAQHLWHAADPANLLFNYCFASQHSAAYRQTNPRTGGSSLSRPPALPLLWRPDGDRRETDCRPDPTPFPTDMGHGCRMKSLFTSRKLCVLRRATGYQERASWREILGTGWHGKLSWSRRGNPPNLVKRQRREGSRL